MNIEFSLQIVEKFSNINFRVLSSTGSRDVPWGQTDKRTDMTKLIVAFRSFVNVSNNRWLWRRNAELELHEIAKRKSIPILPSFYVTVMHNRVQDMAVHTSNLDKKSMQDWLTGRKFLSRQIYLQPVPMNSLNWIRLTLNDIKVIIS